MDAMESIVEEEEEEIIRLEFYMVQAILNLKDSLKEIIKYINMLDQQGILDLIIYKLEYA